MRSVGGSFRFAVERRGRRAPERLGEVALPLRGVHNVVNALGAVAMATCLGVPFDDAAAALARFGGVARRFDIRGVDGGATFVDDYGHLPAEIAAVIAAARDSGDGWGRVIVAFQPNRFNRIAEMWREYADAFVGADVVVLTEIYPSGTTPIPGVTGKLIVNAVLDAHPRGPGRVAAAPRRRGVVPRRRGRPGRRVHLDGLRRHRHAARGDPRPPGAAAEPMRERVTAMRERRRRRPGRRGRGRRRDPRARRRRATSRWRR